MVGMPRWYLRTHYLTNALGLKYATTGIITRFCHAQWSAIRLEWCENCVLKLHTAPLSQMTQDYLACK